ncbi:MAG: hypothetical protein IKF68_00640 [Erysipelotrichaceae bacterium]|nr:hypothetical protein [Erysipelotrichaceae bacterium]
MIKNKYIAYGIYIVCFVIFWNLLEFLFNTSGFRFNWTTDIVVPCAAAMTSGHLLFLRNRD